MADWDPWATSGKNSISCWVILLAGMRLANAAPSSAIERKCGSKGTILYFRLQHRFLAGSFDVTTDHAHPSCFEVFLDWQFTRRQKPTPGKGRQKSISATRCVKLPFFFFFTSVDYNVMYSQVCVSGSTSESESEDSSSSMSTGICGRGTPRIPWELPPSSES